MLPNLKLLEHQSDARSRKIHTWLHVMGCNQKTGDLKILYETTFRWCETNEFCVWAWVPSPNLSFHICKYPNSETDQTTSGPQEFQIRVTQYVTGKLRLSTHLTPKPVLLNITFSPTTENLLLQPSKITVKKLPPIRSDSKQFWLCRPQGHHCS